eukprot:5273790-Pleurochrysis_carterae.AAC.1
MRSAHVAETNSSRIGPRPHQRSNRLTPVFGFPFRLTTCEARASRKSNDCSTAVAEFHDLRNAIDDAQRRRVLRSDCHGCTSVMGQRYAKPCLDFRSGCSHRFCHSDH